MSESKHIVLTSHPPKGDLRPPQITWGAETPHDRGPVIGSFNAPQQRNVIGVHSGAYGLYRALAIAAGTLDPVHKPDLTNTSPTTRIGPFPQWTDPAKIVSFDPYGHMVAEAFEEFLDQGLDIRPTIAVTRARIHLAELREAMAAGRIEPDGKVLMEGGEANVTKAAIEPVWYLPGIAERLAITEADLRRSLFEYTGGMFTELVTRSDLNVFLPPIGNISVYILGDVSALWDPAKPLACRVHDECNGSDVFGSDICTCRPYLTHGIEESVRTAQDGGAGLIVYNRKEGRALGEVTKFLVYNARKRNPGGDNAASYFERTECVAGVQDMRFQDLMPDIFHWLGITRIDRFVSMSNMKYDALVAQGIEIGERIPIPDELIPPDAQVEMDAKKAAGYFTDETVSTPDDLTGTKGRAIDDY
ncbi:MAG: GTP cyclohydrolase II [Hyphomicrobiales bacterium]